MRRVYFRSDNIITSLGFTTLENAANISKGITGIRHCKAGGISPFPLAFSAINTPELEENFREYTMQTGIPANEINASRLEKMIMLSLGNALKGSSVNPADPRTVMILSTTKGNVDLLDQRSSGLMKNQRIHLWQLAGFISKLYNGSNVPVVVSNACTSGSVAIMLAARLIASGKFDHAIITGGDIISEFVISGFQSFQALSPEPCRPFDADRNGLSLGEGCGTLVMSCEPPLSTEGKPVCYLGGATSNDANHISGPSRDGEGLYLAVSAAMNEANATPADLDFISAHGTATPYNDEMESLALAWAGLEQVPVNSFKGYFGHTLGAAGLIETILSAYSIRNGSLFKSLGFSSNGVSRSLNIITENTDRPVRRVLKTASGFGGSNAALIIG